jgi:hypothetical protein
LLYKGSGEFLETDEATRTVVIKASGKDSRGAGTAAATVTVTLRAEGDSTVGSVVTDLSVTGKPAQFGRGMISEVSGKILDNFAGCLASRLAPAGEPEPEPEPAVRPKLSLVEAPETAETVESPETAEPVEAVEAVEAIEAVEAAVPVEPRPAEPKAAKPKLAAVAPVQDPIDLLSYAGPSVLKRVVPLLAVLFAVLAIVAIRRRSR